MKNRRNRLEKNINKDKFAHLSASYIKLYGASILKSEKMQESKNNLQHGSTSVYEHSVFVAYYAVYYALKHGWKVDLQSLVRACLLHDYFQYDWHVKGDGSHRLHGFHHARRALNNARKDYDLNWKEENAIDAHMFPLNLRFPLCKEALLTTMADKATAYMEGLKIKDERMMNAVKELLEINKDTVLSPSCVIYTKNEERTALRYAL